MKNFVCILCVSLTAFLTGCEKKVENINVVKVEKINDIISKDYKSTNTKEYSQADTKIIINGSGNITSLRDEIKDAISINLKVPFTEIKITPSEDNYFRIIGDTNLVENVLYQNEKKIIKFDFKSMVGEQENPLKLEIFSNNIEYIDNNSSNYLTLSGSNKNINIQNKGVLNIKLKDVKYNDFLINNLGKLDIDGNGNVENLYITDLNMGEYLLKDLKSKNLSIKTRGMSKGTLNVSYLAMGEIAFMSDFIITGNTKIKKVQALVSAKVQYQ